MFNDIDEIKRTGFSGFYRIRELINDSSLIPISGGVYLVLNNYNNAVDFLEIGTGGYFKGKNPNVPLAVLRREWVDNTKVIYVGKATSLKSRIKQYLGFGQGKNIGHYGGRYIWQIKHSTDLIVCWKTIASNPEQFESELLRQFLSIYGCLPFANLRG